LYGSFYATFKSLSTFVSLTFFSINCFFTSQESCCSEHCKETSQQLFGLTEIPAKEFVHTKLKKYFKPGKENIKKIIFELNKLGDNIHCIAKYLLAEIYSYCIPSMRYESTKVSFVRIAIEMQSGVDFSNFLH
jgi:hypothetical protein